MSNTTRKEVIEAMKELEEAYIEKIEAAEGEDKAKLRTIKAQKRLMLARDTVRSLQV